MECKTPIKTELKQYDDYAINNNFTSITTNGPPMEFINNIDKESALRNQGIATRKITIWAYSSRLRVTYTPPTAYGRSETQTHTKLLTPVFAANRRIKKQKTRL
jgi:hypothetical protein